ncbi:hypothetical protein QR680_013287 [Steinernema hermaphroditum]|uniref:Calpain catalytic domain-containing protein n=1 Tax=Steinernema hermaphroditum TaxID=289476 RepID=A0AA39M288_9BILA|nr:hypothetical protein QR680_013287 [Steinernema hermaphroditum]
MEEVTRLVTIANRFDRNGQVEAAISYYMEAFSTFIRLIDAGIAPMRYLETANSYRVRADFLRDQPRIVCPVGATKSEHQLNKERVKFLMTQALENDEAGNSKEAVELYSQAVDFCLKASRSSDCDEGNRRNLHALAKQALERAEALKGIQALPPRRKSADNIDTLLPVVPTDEISQLKVDNSPQTPSASRSPARSPKASPVPARRTKIPAKAGLDALEMKVLTLTSTINGRMYVPFIQVDLNERFAYPVPFTDKDGLLALSDKQKQRLKAWMRPDEFMQTPKIIDKIDSCTIKQTIVSDCSFVASLAISARYEKRFGKRLVTSIIYPQHKSGEPVFNPCGKYMIKFHINGVYRKVIIDDRLPIGNHGEFLCSYSQNKNELWVSLLEKAYMKVMGGYDFPGSNSNIDLHALTGWIPERIAIRPSSAEFDGAALFEKLLQRFHQGHCLITLATGKMEQSEQDRTGLVDAHAYAVLDLRKYEDRRMLLVKNPWTHLRWKGRYSERDTASWTRDLCKALQYNPTDAQQFDDGVFWIDFESVCRFFDVFYVNWDPALFCYSYGLHSSWSACTGPVKDLYSVADNPQYTLEVNNVSESAAVWILLTRHITDKNDFADNKEYITVLVYKGGKKIYLPFDPKPLIDGARINSPHYLCKMVVKEPGWQKYTLLVAQYEKTNTINYTLKVYSSAEIRLNKTKVPYTAKKTETGEWKGKTAGGCGNGSSRETYMNNPIFYISLDDGSDDNSLMFELRGPKQYSVGFEVKQVSSPRQRPFERKDSGAYRPGCTVLTLDAVPAGTYALQPMTFLQNQEGPFIIRMEASCGFTVKRVQ